ncbi:transmembrane protein 186 [Gastrophryne carolinensis]
MALNWNELNDGRTQPNQIPNRLPADFRIPCAAPQISHASAPSIIAAYAKKRHMGMICATLRRMTKPSKEVSKTKTGSKSKDKNTKPGDKSEFRLIYKFSGIRMCKVVSKLKILQTGLTFTILPPVYYLYLQGQMSPSSAMYLTGVALFAGVMLYSLTYYLRRIIGMMYVNHDATTLRVAHLSFWGNRKDIYVPVEDLKKLTETGDSKGEVLLSLKRYSTPETFYFTLHYGHILDKDTFRLIFGDLK